MKLLVKNIGQLVIVSRGKSFLAGPEMNDIQVEEGEFAVVVSDDGNIAALGPQAEVLEKYDENSFLEIIDALGGSVMPGLIDGHTHPVWAGDRVHEFALKLSGASYMEVHQAGGGIGFTVEKTRAASEGELLRLLKGRLQRMLSAGTTTAECKSGYGLERETEMKMLRVLEKARSLVPVEISSTFCGAHSVPKGSNAEQATKDVIENQLKAVLDANASGELNVENIDVFVEKGVFEIQDSRKILSAGKEAGLRLNLHGDELYPLGGADLGAELGAQAISHLEEISEKGIKDMAASGSVAVILPSTAYILRLKPPPVRAMIENGVIVALGTDFNPNAHCLSLPTIMHLACVNLRMTLKEALAGATINAAHSIGRGATHGSLEVGKTGDMVVLKEKKWEHLVYQFGDNNVIRHVIKQGKLVYSN